MARRDRLEERLDRVARIAAGEKTAHAVEELRGALGDSSSLIVEAAARAAQSLGAGELAPEMRDAFDRFFEDRSDRDKGCVAKTACLAALDALGEADAERLLRAIRHVQMEAVYGPAVDVAGPLRSEGLAGLLGIGYDALPEELVRLLNDPLSEVRLAAIQCAGHLGGRVGALLLRYKALAGDADPALTSECFSALMRSGGGSARDFVVERLETASTEVALGAALALGEAAKPEYLDVLLRVRADRVDEEFRRGVLLPVSLLRTDAAYDFLLDVLRTEDSACAAEAVKVLRLYAEDADRRRHIEDAVRARDDAFVWRVFRIKYPTDPPS